MLETLYILVWGKTMDIQIGEVFLQWTVSPVPYSSVLDCLTWTAYITVPIRNFSLNEKRSWHESLSFTEHVNFRLVSIIEFYIIELILETLTLATVIFHILTISSILLRVKYRLRLIDETYTLVKSINIRFNLSYN